VSIRANVSSTKEDALIPGEVLYTYKRSQFDRRHQKATDEQVREHLYYAPCAICGRSSSDPACTCLSAPPSP
jgi:hypothetical protein